MLLVINVDHRVLNRLTFVCVSPIHAWVSEHVFVRSNHLLFLLIMSLIELCNIANPKTVNIHLPVLLPRSLST